MIAGDLNNYTINAWTIVRGIIFIVLLVVLFPIWYPIKCLSDL